MKTLAGAIAQFGQKIKCGLCLGLFLLIAAMGSGEIAALDPRHTAELNDFIPWMLEEGDRVHLGMRIGTVEDRYETTPVLPGESVHRALPAFEAGDSLLLRFVVPDDLEGHCWSLAVQVGDERIHERSGTTRGFGPRSLFVSLGETARRLANGDGACAPELSVENLSTRTLYLESLTLMHDFESWVEREVPDEDFVLSFLTTEFLNSEAMWYVDLTPIGRIGSTRTIRKALGMEVHYPNRNAVQMRRTAEGIGAICEELGLDFLPITTSWWKGTPGQAAHEFNVRARLDLQQICWSPTDTYDEGEELRELLGDRWDIRYGLTIPNKWSDTPWPTMNHPELNAWRHEKVQEAVRVYEEHLAERTVAHVAENEPAYWAWPGSNPTYPVERDPLWADFNPHTVADALADGVYLDPSNGLDMLERAWFQFNLARYIENTVAAIRRADPERVVYSHVLLSDAYFPFGGTGHARPYADCGRVSNARLGVEMLWGTDMDALWRVREWGRWGCVNREELDSWSIEYHLATLRANYAMGSDMLNSYNWHNMRDDIEGNPADYFNAFIAEVESGGEHVVADRPGDGTWISVADYQESIAIDEAFPWFNRIGLNLRAARVGTLPLRIRLLRESDGAIVAFRAVHPSEVPEGEGIGWYDFGDLAWLDQGDRVRLHLRGDAGWMAMSSSDQKIAFALSCDINRERLRSHYVTGRREGMRASTIIP